MQRTAVKVVAVVASILVAYKVARFVWNRARG